MSTASPIDTAPNGPASTPRAVDPVAYLAALAARLASLPVTDRARAIMAPEAIAAAASLADDHPEIAALGAAIGAAARGHRGTWNKAVREARVKRMEVERLEEERERLRTLDPRSYEGKLAKLRGDLHYGKGGTPEANHHNLAAILANDPRWSGVLAYHAMRESVWTTKRPPWGAYVTPAGAAAGEWTDEDATRLAAWLASEWEMNVKTSVIMEAVAVQAHRHVVDPVRDYLVNLPAWDGVPRLDTWTIRHLGAEDTPYVRAVSSRWMISLVARTMHPGCKVDCMIVFVGGQGKGKSTAFRALCADEAWYADLDVEGNKDDAQNLRGKWIVELGEMSGMARAELTRLKRFGSLKVDTYRASYGRKSRDFPRRCCFGGTSNDETPLRDTTGDRRYWPIDVSDEISAADVERGITAERDQLWAEALHRYRAREPYYVDTPELEALTRQAQEDHRKADMWEPKVADFIAAKLQEKCDGTSACRCPHCHGVTESEVLSTAIGIEIAGQDAAKGERVRGCLRVLGWSPRRKGPGAQRRERHGAGSGRQVRPWYPPPRTVDEMEREAIEALGQEEQRFTG